MITLPNGIRLYVASIYDDVTTWNSYDMWQERGRMDWLCKVYRDGYDLITGVNMWSVVRSRLYHIEEEMSRRKKLGLW